MKTRLINLLVALPAEAKPLIRAFGLQRQQPDGEFPHYVAQDISLTLTGPGIAGMERAIGFLLQHQTRTALAWINIGIAGHGSLEREKCLLADTVMGSDPAHHWHLPPLQIETIERCRLCCVAQPVTAYEENTAYDMESAGFTAGLAQAGLLEQCHILKVVSDNPRQSSTEINGRMVKYLIEQAIPTLSSLINHIEQACRSELKHEKS